MNKQNIVFNGNQYGAELRSKIIGTGKDFYSSVLVSSPLDLIALEQTENFSDLVQQNMQEDEDWAWLVQSDQEMDFELSINGKIENQDQLDGLLLGSPYQLYLD